MKTFLADVKLTELWLCHGTATLCIGGCVLPDIVLNSSSIAASAALVEVCALPSAILVLFSFRAVDYAVLLYLRIRRIVRRILYPGRMSFFAAGSCCVGQWRRAVERVRGRDAAGDDQRRCCNVVYNYVRGRRPYEGLSVSAMSKASRPHTPVLQVIAGQHVAGLPSTASPLPPVYSACQGRIKYFIHCGFYMCQWIPPVCHTAACAVACVYVVRPSEPQCLPTLRD